MVADLSALTKLSNSLFHKKPLAELLAEAQAEGQGTLRRVLGPIGLIAFGIGVIVGAGLFSVTGTVAAAYSGPAITISFVIAAIGCAFAGLCYAEFASMIPVSGSAYTYAYATMGQLIAWVVGWDLVLEYAVGSVLVSVSWSQYFSTFLSGFGITIPQAFTACPWDGGIVNLPAVFIVVVMSLFLIRGTQQSAWLNNLIVAIKVGIILIFIILGWRYIDTANYSPYIPANTGQLGEFGWSGILRGAGVVFFAFLGFDAVSTAAQETRNPKHDMPIGILCSLLIVTILYVLFGHVLTGVANYQEFVGQSGLAPVSVAISHIPDYPWLGRLIVVAILFGFCSVILVMLMAQSRVFMAMSKDGLLPPLFSHIHKRYRTPARSNLLFMFVVALLAGFIPARIAGEMCSIGTLLAFTIVCAGVLIIRKTTPEDCGTEPSFRCPFVPIIPILGILTCLTLMIFLPADTWIRLVVWMLIGLDIYAHYGGPRTSPTATAEETSSPRLMINGLCLALSGLCVLTGFWHQMSVGWSADKTLLLVAALFGTLHMIYYLWRTQKNW